jgi:hypothetical protein
LAEASEKEILSFGRGLILYPLQELIATAGCIEYQGFFPPITMKFYPCRVSGLICGGNYHLPTVSHMLL